MELRLKRDEWGLIDTPGTLTLNGAYECRTLEDPVREDAFRPVAEWKMKKRTAIPAGRYRLELVDSPAFGKDTLTIVGVDGFEHIRIHAGNDEDNTDGCPLTGLSLEREADGSWRVPGGQSGPALAALKAKVVPAIKAGEPAWITIENPDEWILAGGHRRVTPETQGGANA
jgi:hypothetical protein